MRYCKARDAEIEGALWIALRSLQEKAKLSRRLAANVGPGGLQRTYNEAADEADRGDERAVPSAHARRPPERVSPVAELGQNLLVRSEPAGQFTVLTATGRLDAATYLTLRDTIVKAALDDARAVIVDVTELLVPQASAWAVFTSARWHVQRWPDVPILLVCAHTAGQNAAIRNGITRYVPVYSDRRTGL